jgi:hypothetical protein
MNKINPAVGQEQIDLAHLLFDSRVTPYKTVIHKRETYG